MKLYEITEKLNSVIEHGDLFISASDGEIFNPEALDALKMERDEKVNNCLMVMRQYETDAMSLDAEIKRLTALKKHYAGRAEWMKNYVQHCLQGERFKSDLFNVTYRMSKAVEIKDFRQVPEIYYKDQGEKDILKGQIMEVLKNGGTVPGAELVEHTSMIVK